MKKITTFSIAIFMNLLAIAQSSAVIVNSASICFGQSATLNTMVSPPGGTYSWSPGGATTDSIIVSPTSTTIYTVTYTPLVGSSSSATGTVTVSPPLSAFPSGDVTICNGNSTTISATAFGGNGGPYIFTWTPGGTGGSVTVSPTTTTTYTVTIDDGCSLSGTATLTVTVDPCTGIQSLIASNSIVQLFPNPFTLQTRIDLNADYKNGTLKVVDILGEELRSMQFSGKEIIFKKEELKAGIYFIQIISENKIIATNKIIIN